MGPFNSVVSSTYHAEFLTILFGLRARISNWPSGKFFTDVPNCFLSFLYIKHIQLLGGPLSNCCWSSPLRISVRAPKLAFKTNAGCTGKNDTDDKKDALGLLWWSFFSWVTMASSDQTMRFEFWMSSWVSNLTRNNLWPFLAFEFVWIVGFQTLFSLTLTCCHQVTRM